MPETFRDRLKHAWNAFLSRDPPNEDQYEYKDLGYSSYVKPDRIRLTRGNERSIITAIYNRIALDCAGVNFEHARLDDNGRYVESMKSGLNYCLNVEANVDQTGRSLIQDAVMSMLDEGCVAIVPTDTSIDPSVSTAYDILEMRTAKILTWYPEHIKVRIYNERDGKSYEITVPKKMTAIIENPFYSVMNERNSVMQRLIRKLNLLDIMDEENSSGKLDLIIQLPYIIKTEARKQQAENRRKDIETQLRDSKYGIAYTDGTEHITQLNRAVENKLLDQISYLTDMLYGQLGVTKEILNGTASQEVMMNYMSRVIEPIVSAITLEMNRKFLTKTARSQKQSVVFFTDPFKLVPVVNLAGIADTFTRNEIMSSNEIRQIIGLKPAIDPKADELRNKNMYPEKNETFPETGETEEEEEKILKGENIQNGG